MTWRLLTKALGDRESDRVALIRPLRHWGPKRPQHTPVRDFKRTGDGCSTHATTMHEVDEVAIKLVGGHAGQFG